MRYFASISYRGKDYNGWQIQNNAESIEGVLEKAFSMYFREDINLVGAGRTDTGVNATSFYAHFDSENENILNGLANNIYKINAILPYDITLNDIIAVHPEAHARFDATSRTYRYYVHTCKDPFCKDFSCHVKFRLDVDKMNSAAALLLGTHDFSSFEKAHGGNLTSICNVTQAHWDEVRHTVSRDNGNAHGQYLVFTITANRFLRNMVRAVVGSLIEVGRGARDTVWIKELLEGKDRKLAGQSMPGNALFLHAVTYPYIDSNGKYTGLDKQKEK